MPRSTVALMGVVTLTALALGCTSGSKNTLAPTPPDAAMSAPDGSTLKVTAPVPTSPIDGAKPSNATFNLVATDARPTFGSSVPLQYRFQILTPAGSVVPGGDSGPVNGPSWTYSAFNLTANATYNWRVRAEFDGAAGPWSRPAVFQAPDPALVNDPLTNGTSVGIVGGGSFVPGRGWRADSVHDFIVYDIPTTPAASLEFDVIGVETDEPAPYDKGLKFYSMGDGSLWDFMGFRNQHWKVSLEKKSGRWFPDESGKMESIFRLGLDDNRVKTGNRAWHEAHTYHVKLVWGYGNVKLWLDDELIADENYVGEYAPPNHRIALGCPSRAETLVDAIWSNVVIREL